MTLEDLEILSRFASAPGGRDGRSPVQPAVGRLIAEYQAALVANVKLAQEIERLQAVNESLANRVAAQSDLLTQRAEKQVLP